MNQTVEFGRNHTRKEGDHRVRNLRRGILVLLTISIMILNGIGSAQAQPAPTTLQPSNITETSAQLNGEINPNGQDTYWMFVYTQVGATIVTLPCPMPAQIVPGTSSPYTPVSCTLSNLQPGTTYSFHLVAYWSGGDEKDGDTLSFTTSGLPQMMPMPSLTIVKPGNAKQTMTTNVSPPGSGSVTPNCPSGCQTVVGSIGDIVATPAAGWAFSSWTITGGTCPAGPTSNPCSHFTMPNNPVTFTANFISTSSQPQQPQPQQPNGPVFDFALSVSPSTVSVTQGDTAHYAVNVMYSDPSYAGTMINVQLSGLGPGMDWHVTQMGDLTITTTPTTPTGSYAVSMTGSANGVMHQTGMTLIVTSAQPATTAVTTTTTASTTSSSVPFDFSVSISPSSQSVDAGGSVSYVVSVLPLAGSPVAVSLAVMGLPGDIRGSFTTQSANPPYTSTLNLDLSTSAANPGSYTLSIVANAAGNTKTATATLIIQQKAQQPTTAPTTTATGGSNWSDVLQQNSLIIIAALLALVVVLIVLAKRGRGQRRTPQQTGRRIRLGANFCR